MPNNAQIILSFIREHPEGTRRRQIASVVPSMPLRSVDAALAHFRIHNLIYNDGIRGSKGSTWYPVTHDDVPAPFPQIAADLVSELRTMHYEAHEVHLAKRLQEIFGETI